MHENTITVAPLPMPANSAASALATRPFSLVAAGASSLLGGVDDIDDAGVESMLEDIVVQIFDCRSCRRFSYFCLRRLSYFNRIADEVLEPASAASC